VTPCKFCGNPLARNADVCPKCGGKVVRLGCAGWGCLFVVAIFALMVLFQVGKTFVDAAFN
jgi:predicted amidophosphoribosyltransferase